MTSKQMEASLGSLQNPDFSLVLSSCEPELQELMRQIDIMVGDQKRQWELEVQDLQQRLKSGDEELLSCRNLVQRQDLEIGVLRRQLEEAQPGRQELICKYEQQLQKLKEELDKLKRSYQKLQRKHLKEVSGGATTKETSGSESTRPSEKLQQLSADWEQQCSRYQNQVTTLESQNKRLTEELTRMNAAALQRHSECCSELQRVSAQLQTAQDGLHAQELELQRLRPLDKRLGQKQREQQVPSVQRQELHATLDSHDATGLQTSTEWQRLEQTLQAKDQVIRSLEDCLAAQGRSGVESLAQDLEKTITKLHCAQACEAHLKAELACLRERLERLSRQRADQSKAEELRSVRAEHDSTVAEMKKLREELLRARLTHGGELEGMRKEVSRLTEELHQRDASVSALSGVKLQLQRRQEEAQQSAQQLEMTQAQLEALQAENQRLKVHLQTLEEATLPQTQRGESLVSSQPRPPLAHRPQVSQICRDREDSSSRSEGHIQRLFQDLHTLSHTSREKSCSLAPDSRPRSAAPRSSSCSSSSSSSCSSSSITPGHRKSDQSAEEAQRPEDIVGSLSRGRSSPSVDPSPPSPAAPVSRFLEQENQRSSELLQRLDSHIQVMMENNLRTVSRFLPSGSGSGMGPGAQHSDQEQRGQ